MLELENRVAVGLVLGQPLLDLSMKAIFLPMIDAATIKDIEERIGERDKGNYIALVLFCRYRDDELSVPWRVAANFINYHFSSGRDLDIFVPGFSFYGANHRDDLGHAVKLRNSKPQGYYYPKALVDAEEFLTENMPGFHLGSSVTAVAIEVEDDVPDWKNGAVINLSNGPMEEVERQIMEIINGSKISQGTVDPSSAKFRRNFRLNSLVKVLVEHGWDAASAFSGIGALVLTLASSS
ncbi:hypothetical protein RGQ15_10130 [Paracoccus sp. MBLB3053]|uniref:Uncharacterized protein n=1 Tax=Paracoccus aurantius TaxID=3073814 RepID=A0ABU2HSB5_9RHOB|nr:hypothetical protein [Paracoccus sp. MBLB3053]MDS9467923.1 hypothetical protein [Paracoccus sp. MBLB3053]